MFFQVYMGPEETAPDPAAAKETPELNRDGEPKYIVGADGKTTINDPTLLISKEASTEPLSEEEMNKVQILTQIGWAAYSSVSRPPPGQ